MTVADLIEKLKAFPPDAHVVFPDFEDGGAREMQGVPVITGLLRYPQWPEDDAYIDRVDIDKPHDVVGVSIW